MKDRPILFNGEMVRAVLDGTKTQTRRVMKSQPAWCPESYASTDGWTWRDYEIGAASDFWTTEALQYCPYGKPGDQLWVRETWAPRCSDARELAERGNMEGIQYRADPALFPPKWTPSIHMPRWASRIQLQVTAVRVERVQEINVIDAEKEGIGPTSPDKGFDTSRLRFRKLWDSINAKRGFGWDVNPWVWVVEFERVTT